MEDLNMEFPSPLPAAFFRFQRVRKELSSMMQRPGCFGFVSLYYRSYQLWWSDSFAVKGFLCVCGKTKKPANSQEIPQHGPQSWWSFQPGLRETGNTFLSRRCMAREQSLLTSEVCSSNRPIVSWFYCAAIKLYKMETITILLKTITINT